MILEDKEGLDIFSIERLITVILVDCFVRCKILKDLQMILSNYTKPETQIYY